MLKATKWLRRHYYLSTGILMFFSFPSYDIWFLKLYPLWAWFALIPLFIYVRNANFKNLYISSFFTGVLGIFLSYHWIGDFGNRVPGGSFVILVFVVPLLAILFASKILAAEYLSRRFERLRPVIYPSVWIIVDGVQSIGFLAFPWTYWAYSQYPFTAFIQISSLVGVFGVTFIMLLFSTVAADFVGTELSGRPTLGQMVAGAAFRKLTAALMLVAISVSYGAFRLAQPVAPEGAGKLRLAMVQSCIDPWVAWNRNKFRYLSELQRLTAEAMEGSPDFLVWSESATLELISYGYRTGGINPFIAEVLNIPYLYKIPLLTGEIGIQEDHYARRLYPQNNAVLISEEGEPVKTYPKIHLVPFGEWFPYAKWFPFIRRITESFGASNFVPGSEPGMFELKGARFGALICYEGIFHGLCRRYRLDGAQYFINITNLGWTQTYKGHMQGFASAIFRAVENGIWFVSAGNTGYTALVDPLGRVTSSIPILKKGSLVADIDFSRNRATFYSIAGDIVLYFALSLVIILCFILIIRRYKTT